MEWILASASPRRKELFGALVTAFTVRPAQGEERAVAAHPETLVKALARQKAEEVAALPLSQDKGVLGADTIVAFGGEILGKPKDEGEAKRMLRALSGNTHEVYTGVCMIYTDKEGKRKTLTGSACTKVRFHELSDAFIAAYIQGGSPMDKAGAYGIQDGGLVKEIEGSFSNVVGLPVELCQEMLDIVKRDSE